MVNFRKILLKDHEEMHQSLDKLCSHYITDTEKLLSNTTVMELLQWSNQRIEKDKQLLNKKNKRRIP